MHSLQYSLQVVHLHVSPLYSQILLTSPQSAVVLVACLADYTLLFNQWIITAPGGPHAKNPNTIIAPRIDGPKH